jgi:hypothetical protein
MSLVHFSQTVLQTELCADIKFEFGCQRLPVIKSNGQTQADIKPPIHDGTISQAEAEFRATQNSESPLLAHRNILSFYSPVFEQLFR